eukprot:6914035-Lingulodinium_polyedra.AAC.1
MPAGAAPWHVAQLVLLGFWSWGSVAATTQGGLGPTAPPVGAGVGTISCRRPTAHVAQSGARLTGSGPSSARPPPGRAAPASVAGRLPLGP